MVNNTYNSNRTRQCNLLPTLLSRYIPINVMLKKGYRKPEFYFSVDPEKRINSLGYNLSNKLLIQSQYGLKNSNEIQLTLTWSTHFTKFICTVQNEAALGAARVDSRHHRNYKHGWHVCQVSMHTTSPPTPRALPSFRESPSQHDDSQIKPRQHTSSTRALPCPSYRIFLYELNSNVILLFLSSCYLNLMADRL